MIDKDKLKRRFSKNAKTYDEYASVQKLMGDHLMKLIETNSAINILEVGSGTGYLTKQLKLKFPYANIIAVDIAQGMIDVAKEKFESDEINFICGDIETLNFDMKFDLIISNATFQWFNNPFETLSKLKSIMNENSTLCFSTFANNTFHELHTCYKNLQDNNDTYIKPGQKFLEVSEIKVLLSDVFYANQDKLFTDNSTQELVDIDEKEYTQYFDTCQSFFKSIKKIGANNSQSSNSIKDPSFIYKVIEQYEKNYTLNGKIQATYHSLFVKLML